MNYAPSKAYLKKPDRAFVYPLEGQPVKSGFMRPGQPKKYLPGRYRVKPGGYTGDIANQEVTITAHETSVVTLKLRSEP